MPGKIRYRYLWPLVGEVLSHSGWCDEHALPHVATFPIHLMDESGVYLNVATVSRCDLDEEDA